MNVPKHMVNAGRKPKGVRGLRNLTQTEARGPDFSRPDGQLGVEDELGSEVTNAWRAHQRVCCAIAPLHVQTNVSAAI